MSRVPQTKALINTRLANKYGGWMYCGHCGETIGYLCYVTYDSFTLTYTCSCGASGSVQISFSDETLARECEKPLLLIKNRRCCPDDQSPLFSLNEKRVSRYQYTIVCNKCGLRFTGQKQCML